MTSFSIVVLLIGIMQWFIYQNFEEYVNQTELGKLDLFVEALADSHRESGGWDRFTRNPRQWNEFLWANLPKNHNVSEDRESFHQPRPNDFDFGGERPHPGEFGREQPHPFPGPPMHHPGRGRIQGGQPIDPLQIGRRLSLFDEESAHIAGHSRVLEENTIRPITVDGKTIGWLGLKTEKNMYHPMDAEYLTAQTRAFYLIGFGILALTAIISFFLSKHLLAPVRRLADGTKALAEFEFDTKIEVRSGDELGQLANDFNQMAQTLKKYETLRRQWLTDISHELRTPLSILRGEIEAVRDGVRKLNMATMDSLHAEVIRLGSLVENLHRLSMADSGNLHFQKRDIRPLAILRETILAFRGRLDRQHIAVRYVWDENDEPVLSGDYDHLARLFSNLLENTIRYTDPPGTLEITARCENGALALCFEDTPPGVPKVSLGRIFERLFRVDKSRSRALGGSGLGLSICRQIVECHGGTIRAETGKLGGLAVILEFPLTHGENRAK